MTITKGTVPKKNAPAGGLTGLTFYEQNCNGTDGISLVGIDFNTVWGHVGLCTGISK